MEKLENLLFQQELIQAQIDDVKTSHIRQQIDDLRHIQQDLFQKSVDAKARRKLDDESVKAQIAAKKVEIEKLRNLYYSNSYFISGLENQMRLNSEKLMGLEKELKEILLSDA
jgi:Rps23 Pro-64 3,4-dihydroxylase Tpa1-like proline 4-hydroxylase